MARKGEHSRDEIRLMALDAAENIVASEGYDELSARRVASAIGYTVGTLYLVFRNLDDLILQVNGRTLDKLYDYLKAAYPGNPQGAPEETLKALAHAYIAYAETEASRWNMLLEASIRKGDVVPEWYQHKVNRILALGETAVRAFEPDETRAAHAARVLWAGIYGICVLRIRRRLNLAGGQSAENMATTLITNFLRGLRG
ncbi:MAG: TetR/AcrR family transcriptional regulator [Azoarcus sp.]|jgi:AcrR family transcriptional regulator|nr:TetR/AcrR family transcriptional regulator [Azoarcus sp.]